jgi:probable rRNA maturation factor
MYQVDVADNQECLPVDPEAVRDVVRQTLAAEKIVAATISIAIVDNPTMHDLNRQYLNHDYETDVLSFLLESSGGDDDASGIPRGTGKTIDGEVIVSSEYAAKLAPEFGWEPLEELTLYIVHGLLHLCGYDDLTEAELPVMRQREREVLALIGLQQPFAPRPSPLFLSEGSEA